MSEICKHEWVDEYYGTKCKLCETFYPYGCAPWDDGEPDQDDEDSRYEDAIDNCHGSFSGGRFWCGAAGSEDCDWSCPFSHDIGKTRRQVRDGEKAKS